MLLVDMPSYSIDYMAVEQEHKLFYSPSRDSPWVKVMTWLTSPGVKVSCLGGATGYATICPPFSPSTYAPAAAVDGTLYSSVFIVNYPLLTPHFLLPKTVFRYYIINRESHFWPHGIILTSPMYSVLIRKWGTKLTKYTQGHISLIF